MAIASAFRFPLSAFHAIALFAITLLAAGCWSEVEYKPPNEPAAAKPAGAPPPAVEVPAIATPSEPTEESQAQPPVESVVDAEKPPEATAEELFGQAETSDPAADAPPLAEATPPPVEEKPSEPEEPRALFPWEEDDAALPAEQPAASDDPTAAPPAATSPEEATPPADVPSPTTDDGAREPLPWETPAETPAVGERYSSPPPSEPSVEPTAPATDRTEPAPPTVDAASPNEEASRPLFPWETADATEPTIPPAETATSPELPPGSSTAEELVTDVLPTVDPAPKPPELDPGAEAVAKVETPAAIDPENTRHNAWLLGSKWSLQILSEHGSAPAEEQKRLFDETQALAKALGAELPKASSYPPSQPTAAFLENMLPAGRELGGAVGAKHGTEETALVEVALKSNLLLVLGESRPDLIPAVVRAVTAAAERAKLSPDLVQPFATALAGSPTPEQVEHAVFEFHRAVDEHLRTTQ